ncbi:uncharacterized protein LOC113466747 [Diaphorina citri]|uniref:Uncharacterized protein LOC113466747 n=1 Tax=Diaphorina citri TaxID=121845 RepID=A0A3Q0IPJ7_DIACI|nr:uncharacterized protein LOC113466747 [Diaphorina citri]
MGKLRGKYSPRTINAIQDSHNPNNLLFDTPSIANTLAAHFSAVSSDDNYSQEFLEHKNSCEIFPFQFDFSSVGEYNSPFSYQEMYLVLLSCTSKAAGPDGVSFMFLKKLPTQALDTLLELYNFIWSKEIIAILLCLQNIKYLPHSKFLLVSDSMSAIQAIANICSSYKNSLTSKIYSAWMDLKSGGKEVTLMWCPSHCGISGNEAVDMAAKNPCTSTQPLKLCSACDFKPLVAKIIHNMWQTSWNNLLIPNKLKRIKPVIENWTSSNRNNT